MLKINKYCLHIFLLLFALLHAISASAQSGTCGENLTWSLSSKGLLVISGIGDMYDYAAQSAPWYAYIIDIDSVRIEDGVTSVGEYAFYNCGITKIITLPSSITHLGQYAFSKSGIRSLIIKSNQLTEISPYLCYQCSSLTSVTSGNSIVKIGESAFYGCSKMQSITLSDALTEIGPSAFRGCSKLQGITLPNVLNKIGENAFRECTSIETIFLPNDISTIGASAFYGCTSLQSIYIPDHVVYIEASCFAGCSNLLTAELGSRVWKIRGEAFSGCSKLQSITLGADLCYIEKYTFRGCNELVSITSLREFPPVLENTYSTFSQISGATIYAPYPLEYRGWGLISNVKALKPFMVTFLSYDGSVLSKQEVEYNKTPVPPTPPARSGYKFIGWDRPISKVHNNLVITALYREYRTASISFVNENGDLLQNLEVEYGKLPVYTGATPVKPATTQYTYTFAGWKPDIVPVSGEATYTATYDSVVTLYNIQALSNNDELGQVTITQPTIPYVGFTATADNSTICMRYGGTLVGAQPKLQYSYDAQIWNTFVLGTTYDVANGQTFYMRGHNPDGVSIRFDGYSYFIMEGSFEGSGNIMSLIDTTCTATEVPAYCFYRLFYYCTSLTKSPDLTATKLNYNCYANMFVGCSNLNYIAVDFEAWDTNATVNWVSSVPSIGTFVKPQTLPATNGTSYIPSGWTVQDRVANDSSAGVTSGTYECGTVLTLTATPNECAHFVKWEDGETNAERSVVVTENATYTAIFEKDTYTITVESDNENQGTVSVEKN